MGEMRNAYKFRSEALKGRDFLTNVDINGRTTLIWVIKK
jgi:hypothetical protein